MAGKRSAPSGAVEKEKKAGKIALIAGAALAGILTGCLLGLGFYANGYDGVFPGVAVGETDLSGLTYQELSQKIPTNELLQDTVTVTADGQELGTYTQSQLGASIDKPALLDAVWDVGREPGPLGWLKNAWTMFQGQTGGKNVLEPSASSYSREALQAAASQMAERFDRPPVDGSYELTPDGIFATKPSEGRALDQEGLVQALEALDGQPGTVEAPWDAVPPQPLDIEAMAEELNGEATPARYDVKLGKVVEGEVGVSLDAEAAAFVLEAAGPGETVRLPAETVYPELTAQELEAVLFRDVLGTATTTVSGTSVRRNNVKLSGAFVNGTVLNDGDVFNYNQIVGERTTARGFGAAASYVNGQTVDTVGGGICQTSSTIYLAALLANLEIVERYNHRFWPGYIELGMDATVSWGGPEFRFKNNTGYPIRVDVSYVNSKLTVTIVGTKTDDTYVKMSHEVLSTTGYETEYEETSSLSPGTQQQKQNGYTGYEIISYRNVYSGDGTLLSREQEAKSSYKSRNRIILVGVGQASADTPPDSSGTVTNETQGSDSGISATQPDTGGDEPVLPPE